MSRPSLSTVADVVRLPSVLSVPGDALLGAAATRGLGGARRTTGTLASSCCLYLAGMALNDYADRAVDAVERPQRPIPSGRVEPRFVLRLAQGLTTVGLAAAAWGGGLRSLTVAVPLASTVWAYDLVLKGTPVGPLAMATCRGLDVLLGADPTALRAAVGPAAVVGSHTLTVSLVSSHEVEGAGPDVARRALGGTALVTSLAGVVAARALRDGVGRATTPGRGGAAWGAGRAVVVAALLATYATALGRAELAALDDPSPARLQRVVGTGVLGLMPLEAGLLASTGTWAAVAPALLYPLARRLARRRSVT